MHPKDAAGIANSVDPDQSAPLGTVWSGSALFAQNSVDPDQTAPLEAVWSVCTVCPDLSVQKLGIIIIRKKILS